MERYFRSTRSAPYPRAGPSNSNSSNKENVQQGDVRYSPQLSMKTVQNTNRQGFGMHNDLQNQQINIIPIKQIREDDCDQGPIYQNYIFGQNHENLDHANRFNAMVQIPGPAVMPYPVVYQERSFNQSNFLRYNTYGNDLNGNNKSNSSNGLQTPVGVNPALAAPHKEPPVALKVDENKKLSGTSSAGSLCFGQASEESQNSLVKIKGKEISSTEKLLMNARGEISSVEIISTNKRHTADAAPGKFNLDKQKNGSSSGMRIFTCSVEKAMQWYPILADIDINYAVEVIANCVNVRSGPWCEKHIILRDSSGPVLQVIYYEIDFLLPKIAVGSTVRIVGKMTGKNRMKAFKVREVLPFEMSALPRLCAISQHVITKLQATFSSR